MSSKAARNEQKAKLYKAKIAEYDELIKNRVLTYLKAAKEAELRSEFPLALMRINCFEMYDCLGQVNAFFSEAADYVLSVNASVFFGLYDKLCEYIDKLAAQVLHHHIGVKSYKPELKVFTKLLHEIEISFAAATGNKNNGISNKMYSIFIKKQGFFARLLSKRKTTELQYEQKRQALSERISYYKELKDRQQ